MGVTRRLLRPATLNRHARHLLQPLEPCREDTCQLLQKPADESLAGGPHCMRIIEADSVSCHGRESHLNSSLDDDLDIVQMKLQGTTFLLDMSST